MQLMKFMKPMEPMKSMLREWAGGTNAGRASGANETDATNEAEFYHIG